MKNARHSGLENSTLSNVTHGSMAAHIGAQIRYRRLMLALSREQLAETMHVSISELDEYELGTIRMTSFQLFDAAQALGVAISFFFADHGLAAASASPSPHQYPALPDNVQPPRWESSELIATFHRIQDSGVRSCILNLVRSLAAREIGRSEFRQDNELPHDSVEDSTFGLQAGMAVLAPDFARWPSDS